MPTKSAPANVPQFLAGFIDPSGAVVIPAHYEFVNSFKSGHAGASLGGKWGAIDTKGAWTFEPRFDLLKDFDANGHAAFRDGGQWGIVDTRGKVLMQPQALQVLATGGEVALVRGEHGLMLVGYDGKPRIEKLSDFFPFSCGRASAVVDGRTGVVDTAGRWVVEPRYDAIYPYAEDMAAFERDGAAGWLDLNGREAIGANFDAAFDFAEGLARVRKNDLFGFVDKAGKLVIPYTFADVTNFNGGLATAFMPGNAPVAIDTKGKVVFTPPHPWQTPDFQSKIGMRGFADGCAIIAGSKNNLPVYGYVDNKGTVIVAPQYKSADNFTNGGAAVEIERDTFALIDRKGGVLLGDLSRKPVFSEGLASMRLVNPEWEAQQEAVELGAKFEATIAKFNTKLEAALTKSEAAVQKFAKAVMAETFGDGARLELVVYDMNDFGITVSTLADMETVEIPGKPPLAAIAKVFEGGIMPEPKTRKGVRRLAEAHNAASKRWMTWFVEQFRAAGTPSIPMFIHGEIDDDWIDLRTGATVTEDEARG